MRVLSDCQPNRPFVKKREKSLSYFVKLLQNSSFFCKHEFCERKQKGCKILRKKISRKSIKIKFIEF